MPYIIYAIAPGFIDDDVKFNLAIEFTRITFPFLFICKHIIFFSGILKLQIINLQQLPLPQLF